MPWLLFPRAQEHIRIMRVYVQTNCPRSKNPLRIDPKISPKLGFDWPELSQHISLETNNSGNVKNTKRRDPFRCCLNQLKVVLLRRLKKIDKRSSVIVPFVPVKR